MLGAKKEPAQSGLKLVVHPGRDFWDTGYPRESGGYARVGVLPISKSTYLAARAGWML